MGIKKRAMISTDDELWARKENKAVYTTAPVAGGWAGLEVIWAGAENHRILIPELFYLPVAQKHRKSKVEQTDGRTD